MPRAEQLESAEVKEVLTEIMEAKGRIKKINNMFLLSVWSPGCDSFINQCHWLESNYFFHCHPQMIVATVCTPEVKQAFNKFFFSMDSYHHDVFVQLSTEGEKASCFSSLSTYYFYYCYFMRKIICISLTKSNMLHVS